MLDLIGQICVNVQSEPNQKPISLPLLIVRGSYNRPLLGRNWLKKLQLDWTRIKTKWLELKDSMDPVPVIYAGFFG